MAHRLFEKGIEADKAKIDLISQFLIPTYMKQVRSFLCHAEFYRRFIKDFSKMACPFTNLLSKDTPFKFDESYVEAFEKL